MAGWPTGWATTPRAASAGSASTRSATSIRSGPDRLRVSLLFNAPFLFGWAKPVPVAFHRLNDPKRDMIWVASPVPASTSSWRLSRRFLLHPVGQLQANGVTLWLWENLKNAITANVVLACFNMLPIPPLDGGRVLTGLLPRPLAWRLPGSSAMGC